MDTDKIALFSILLTFLVSLANMCLGLRRNRREKEWQKERTSAGLLLDVYKELSKIGFMQFNPQKATKFEYLDYLVEPINRIIENYRSIDLLLSKSDQAEIELKIDEIKKFETNAIHNQDISKIDLHIQSEIDLGILVKDKVAAKLNSLI